MNAEAHSFLRELQTPGEMALVFNPIGFGGRMEPEDAARFQQETIAKARLCPAVPETIGENFERARKLHLYGVLEYEFFTAASDYALLVLEGALRIRFLSYYDHQIPVSRKGKAETLHAGSFDDVRREARFVQLRGNEGINHLPLGAGALLEWARQERLLPGSETRRVDRHSLSFGTTQPIQLGVMSTGPQIRRAPFATSLKSSTSSGAIASLAVGSFRRPWQRVPRVAAIALDGTGASEMGLS